MLLYGFACLIGVDLMLFGGFVVLRIDFELCWLSVFVLCGLLVLWLTLIWVFTGCLFALHCWLI